MSVVVDTRHVGVAQAPPDAAFTYFPVECYVNMSITFDASASTAEGYNVTIVLYRWDFDDGTMQVSTTSPFWVHVFTFATNCTVTLNVTDSQGLWSITSKLVPILPPAGPKADFIWYPAFPLPNQAVSFDASVSQLGWNGTAHPPIVNYSWDFGDGNITAGNYPMMLHTYAAYGNYTVNLAIIDSSGYGDNITQLVRVQAELIGDINGDGVVELMDFFLISMAYNSRPGEANWDPRCDICPWPDGDGVVELMDFWLISQHYLEHL